MPGDGNAEVDMVMRPLARRRPLGEDAPVELETVLAELLETTGASRVTLRQDLPGEVFPVTHEVLAAGVPSIRDVETPNMGRQPVVVEVRRGRQVVQDACRSAFDDPDFQRMLELYGGLAAQIVTPVVRGGELKGIVSLHQLGRERHWSEEEIAAASRAADRVGELL
jgi:GAF domain-containing protein